MMIRPTLRDSYQQVEPDGGWLVNSENTDSKEWRCLMTRIKLTDGSDQQVMDDEHFVGSEGVK